MGLIGRLLSFVRGDVEGAPVADAVIDPGGGANLSAQHFACAGDDSRPLVGDFAVTTDGTGTGAQAAIGYTDPVNAGVAGPGEKRIYARKPDGTVAAVVWLKSTGEVLVESVEGGMVVQLGVDGIVRLGAGAVKGVARLGDSVRVTIPTGTTLVDPNTGATTAPVNIDGTITGASANVRAID